MYHIVPNAWYFEKFKAEAFNYIYRVGDFSAVMNIIPSETSIFHDCKPKKI